MKITIDETITANSYNIWTHSGGCFLATYYCKDCPFYGIAHKATGGCLDFRLSIIRQLSITSYPYVLDAAEYYPELFI